MFPRRNMHLSARSELKSELAESRIETKLPISQAGLLHVCLTDVSRFTCVRAEMPIMPQGPRCAAGAYDQADGGARDQGLIVGGSRMRKGGGSAMLPVEEKWSPGLAELMFLVSTPELKGNLIPVTTAPLRRSSVTESVALPPNTGERNSRPSSARAVRTVRRS